LRVIPKIVNAAVNAKAKAWAFEVKAKAIEFCLIGASRPRPGLEDYITESNLTKFSNDNTTRSNAQPLCDS